MIPNLLDATKDYWKELDKVEAAYQRGDLSIEEVDAKVAKLMADLGRERRIVLRFLVDRLHQIWQEQRELIVGVVLMSILTSAWAIVT